MTNKEIKYRAWDEENKKMIEWSNTFFYDTSPVTGYSGYMDSIEMPLMQYSGIKDRKGREIYEGDIVNIYGYGIHNEVQQEEYVIEALQEFFELKGYFESEECQKWTSENILILGNIYEDYHLIHNEQ